MTERSIQCTFHNVSSDLIPTISSSIGIQNLVSKQKDNRLFYSCSLANANQIRSNLADCFSQYPQIWFSIDSSLSHSKTSSTKLDRTIDNLYFGCLLSTEKFLIHNIPLNQTNQWTIKIATKQTLLIENKSSSIRLTFPLKYLHKEVLIIDGEDFSEMIFSYSLIAVEIENKRIYGNHRLVKSLNKCSNFLISLSPKSSVDEFLHELQIDHHMKIFYTTITIQHSVYQWSNEILNNYPSEHSRYAISLLHSLGYVFDDKYLNNRSLQTLMINLAERDDRNFYQLALRVYYELKKCYWIDLLSIFEMNQSKNVNDDHHINSISVVHLTPTRSLLIPKEKCKGHRALRHPLFQGVNDFCLVYLKPDPPNIYFNIDQQLIEYFEELFQTGLDFNGNHYHLFGASNSQIKEHSFWFIKAYSLNEIDQKRQLLGELHRINNLGTYVARLGLWFSKTDPTNIQLTYCSNESEFSSRVQQGERCVLMINDIERNNYCFTDGNGLVSKGLAKLINNKLGSRSLPSAYQIRMAGCKGLIIIDPESTFEQFYIKIRPSMKKFECNDWTLDICGFSRPTSSRLNNQFIWLLSDLGVSDKTFLRLQQRWFKTKPSISNCSDDLLKNKIPLPVNECRYIYGCALESQLEEGQCFIRYQILNEHGKILSSPKFECVRGRVIVTKNPCPYAGDMLELWAVDLPDLYHLTDVIVFSTQGQRPDFNKIAGSDLDGDGYFVYWGEELRLKYQVAPLDYTPDEKQCQSTMITPRDVIKYCLSTLNATSSGEIYNLHAIIVDKNEEKCSQRTCQTLAIELAKMFSSSVDSGKTGYVVNKNHLQEIRKKCGHKYPDFLGKDEKRSYRSESIVGQLYRNARNYIQGKNKQLEDLFDQLNLDESILPTHRTSSPKTNNNQPASVSIHPGSPLSLSISNDSLSINNTKIPHQFFLLDGMTCLSSLIRLKPSTKPFYTEHNHLTHFRIELDNLPYDHSKSSFPSLSSLFFDQLSSLDYSTNSNQILTMNISFGYIYLLKYSEQQFLENNLPNKLDSLVNHHFLPPLFDTFFPSTILERIEIQKENLHTLQQIFYKSNHTIKREFIQSNDDSISLIFPWFKMNFIDHQREILLICFNSQTNDEIRVHFDKNGRIQSIDQLPKLYFKCFHQQTCPYRSDILYEFRSYSILNSQTYSSIFKHQTLLDPTHPLTLPLHNHIIPIVCLSMITNRFQYDNLEVHISRKYQPIHYKNDDFYKYRCVLGYFEQIEQQQTVELHIQMNRNEKFSREYLRYMMSLANELSQMFD